MEKKMAMENLGWGVGGVGGGGKQGALLSMFYVRIHNAIFVPHKFVLFSISLGTNKRLLSD